MFNLLLIGGVVAALLILGQRAQTSPSGEPVIADTAKQPPQSRSSLVILFPVGTDEIRPGFNQALQSTATMYRSILSMNRGSFPNGFEIHGWDDSSGSIQLAAARAIAVATILRGLLPDYVIIETHAHPATSEENARKVEIFTF